MEKPIAYANSPLTFTSLDDRQFEILVFDYFDNQIKNGHYKGVFDNVVLGAGVGEKGADSKLYLDQNVVGCVQCKKYSINVSDKIIIEEIMKLIMNHFQECDEKEIHSSTLISDINNFSYYIVVSKGFTQKANDLSAQFNLKFLEYSIENIVTEIKNNYSGLKDFDYQKHKQKITETLEKINVKSIIPTTLETVIKSDSSLYVKYFQVDRVIDEKGKQEISPEEILYVCNNALNSFSSLKKSFGQSFSLKRREVDDIISWIDKPLTSNEEPICVVSGNAGMGKSVIISQLISSLNEKKVSILTIKADRLASETSHELGQLLGAGKHDFIAVLKTFIQSNEKSIIIIDQIDALSQCCTNNSKPINLFNQIIEIAANSHRTRVVVSCRTFDLHYDPLLFNYKGKKQVVVKVLSEEQVNEVLAANNLNIFNTLPQKLKSLLSTPLHLEIFINCYSENTDLNELSSLQNLYNKLWSEKIVNNLGRRINSFDFKENIKLLFAIADEMYKSQRIFVAKTKFEDSFSNQITYLKTEGILRGDDKLEFFHQSFFDYCYARNFIQQKILLSDSLVNDHQGLFIRNRVRQILQYLKGVDIGVYISNLKSIFSNDNIRYHIKHLCLQDIAFADNPTIQEKKLVKELIEDEKFKKAFLSLVHGKDWFSFFLEKNVFEEELKSEDKERIHVAETCLRLFQRNNKDELLTYLYSQSENGFFKQAIDDLLFGINPYDNDRYIELIDVLLNSLKINDLKFHHFYYFEHAVQNFSDWLIYKLESFIEINEKGINSVELNFFPGHNNNYHVYEPLWEKHPRKTYEFYKLVFQKVLEKRAVQVKESSLFTDIDFWLYNPQKPEEGRQIYDHWDKLDQLIAYLIIEYKTDPKFVIEQTKSFLQSKYALHQLIAFSVINEFPNNFIEEVYDVFSQQTKIENLCSYSSDLKFLVKNSFAQIYSKFKGEQKASINKVLKDLIPENEKTIRTNSKGIKRFPKSFGYLQFEFMSVISEYIDKKHELKDDYSKLKRKFGKDIENKKPLGIVVTTGSNVLDESAFEKMSSNAWLNSFKKYNKENPEYDSWKDPDIFAHGNKFQEQVKNNPIKFIPLLEKIHSKEIPFEYKIAGIIGLRESNSLEKYLELLPQLIEVSNSKENITSLIWESNEFLKLNTENEIVCSFLKDQVLNGDEGSSYENEFSHTAGINSNKGAAIHTFMDYHKDETRAEKVLDFITKNLSSFNPSSRTCVIIKLSNFYSNYPEKTNSCFEKCFFDNHPSLYEVSMNYMRYFIYNHYERAKKIISPMRQHLGEAKTLAPYFVQAYFKNPKESQEDLEIFIKLDSDNLTEAIIHAFRNLKNKDHIELAIEFVSRFLNIKNQQLISAYENEFLFFTEEIFIQILSFIEYYLKSFNGRNPGNYCLEYLIKCSNKHPEEVLLLTQLFNYDISFEDRKHLFTNPITVIINAYNSVREYDKSNNLLESAMNTFDLLLFNNRYTKEAKEILNKLDEI